MRKHTRFSYCPEHEGWFRGEPRYRQGEVFVEGGWASAGPCEGGICEMVPGRDFFAADFVAAHPAGVPVTPHEMGWNGAA